MNYIMLNNKKINLTDEQVKEIKQSFGIGKVKLADVKVGDVFKIDDYEFIVLEQSGDSTTAILKNLLFENKTFGSNNNYKDSYVDKICNEFAEKIGKKNLIEHTVDLTSDDGLKDYGKIKRYVSLLTCDLYRRYVNILDKYKLKKWWWLVTPYSTPAHEDSTWVKCVAPYGILGDIVFNCNNGVRPFCIFNSSIFVSCED